MLGPEGIPWPRHAEKGIQNSLLVIFLTAKYRIISA
jgi:hypothetical protein